MPQTLPEGKRGGTTAWPLAPLAARVLRQGRRKEEDIVVLRRIPVAFPAYADAEAPVALRLTGAPRAGAGEWGYMRRAPEIVHLRFDGSQWWRPLPSPGDGAPLRLDALDSVLDTLRAEGRGGRWDDWPYAVPVQRFSDRRTVVVAEADLCLKALHTDLDGLALAEAVALAGRFGIIDGTLYRRCDEPVLEVRALGLESRKVSQVVVVPKAAHDAATRDEGGACTLQVFRPDEATEARAYAAAVALALRRGKPGGRAFEVEGGRFLRSEAESLPGEAIGRFVARTRAFVGEFDRAVAEAWLDLRDGGVAEGLPGVAGRFGRLLDRMIAAHPHHWATGLAWFEAHRLLPDDYTTGEEEAREAALDEDAEALAGVF